MDRNGTKHTIFLAALDLFAQHDYHNVSMRDLAKKVGIRPSSIYNHFSSKEELLLSIYHFFEDNMQRLMPDLDALLAMVGHVHPHEIMLKTNFRYPDELRESMAKAMLVTASQVQSDPKADEIIFRNLVDAPYMYDPPLLEEMLRQDLIWPLDIQSYTLIHSTFCHSTAISFYQNHRVDNERWMAGLRMINQLIQVK